MAKYIDADAVIEELRQIYNDCDDWETHISQSDLAESEKRILTTRASATKMAMIEVRLRVDKIPTADVVERKKGKWIAHNNPMYSPFDGSNENTCICNQCEAEAEKATNYCPNCGAKMDGGDKNGNS